MKETTTQTRGAQFRGARTRVHHVTLLSPDRDDWLPHRACKDHDPDLFTPTAERRDPPAERAAIVVRAAAICRTCPVRRQCAAEALRLGTVHGVVAGVDLGDVDAKFIQTEQDREKLERVANGTRIH